MGFYRVYHCLSLAGIPASVARYDERRREEITRLVNQFKTWNWGRWVVLIGGWIAGLRAFSLSSSGDSR
jgi:hypothetical protein